MKKICFITPGYPSEGENVYTFIKELVDNISENDVSCIVIAPQNFTRIILKKSNKVPNYYKYKTESGLEIEVYRPMFFSLGSLTLFNYRLTNFTIEQAIKKTFKNIEKEIDILYGHFWRMGLVASKLGAEFKIPVYIATGESKINIRKIYPSKLLKKVFKDINGVISVSEKNKIESINLGLVKEDKVKVIPNSINSTKFYKKNKKEVREKLGISNDEFIVGFTGSFTERKGVLRVNEAIEVDKNIKAIYIGKGPQEPTGNHILFKGSLSHEKIVDYLNAVDLFVLPTKAEGCCNAIIEAMACGLPIISSDLSFNDEILNNKNSIRINPESIQEIRNAIIYLKDNPNQLEQMSNESIKIVSELTIQKRVNKLFTYINQRI